MTSNLFLVRYNFVIANMLIFGVSRITNEIYVKVILPNPLISKYM